MERDYKQEKLLLRYNDSMEDWFFESKETHLESYQSCQKVNHHQKELRVWIWDFGA
jgi:hypothetical protein